MPAYRFMVPAGSETWRLRAEVAGAITRVHTEVTGAPARYVHCSFVEVAADSVFIGGKMEASHWILGLIRSGRSAALRGRLIHGIADAWSEITGESKDRLAIYLWEIPGANAFEDGSILPEVTEEAGAITN